MSEQIIDTVTRQAAGAVSRRASILALGGMALAAVTTLPAAAKGNKKGKGGKSRKKNNKGASNTVTPVPAAPPAPTGPTGEQLAQVRCANQGDQCRTFITEVCVGDEQCRRALSCCDQFGTCNAAAGLNCIFGPTEN